MLIDFHMHVFPDALAPKAVGSLMATCEKENYPIINYTDGTLSDTLQKMDEWGTDIGVFLNIATKPSQQKNINDFCKKIASDRVVPFGSVHPDAEDWEEELNRIAAMGLKGIKLHPDYQNFSMDEPRVLPLFKKIRDLGLIVVVHAGYDPVSPKFVHCTPAGCQKVLKACPGIKMVLAHMGGMDMWDEVEAKIVGEDVYFDTSFVSDVIDKKQYCRMIKNHGVERILFGSDSPWSSSAKEKCGIEALPLTEEEKQAIYSGNALRLLGDK